MIDFNNASFVKLGPVPVAEAAAIVQPVLLEDEQLVLAFRGLRDFVVFTTRRIIAVNVQGLTGKKKDLTSLPYSRVQAFSVETAGTFDLDAELDLWFSGMGRVRFEFKASADVAQLSRLVASHVL